MMRNVFKFNFPQHEKHSVVGIEVNNNQIEMQVLKGHDVQWENLVYFLLHQEEVHNALLDASNLSVRKSPFKIEEREGMSGCKDFRIRYLEKVGSFYREQVTDLLHISMYGKVGGFTMYLPDLAEILVYQGYLIREFYNTPCDINYEAFSQDACVYEYTPAKICWEMTTDLLREHGFIPVGRR